MVFGQPPEAFDIGLRIVAPGFPGCESLHGVILAEWFVYAVYPPKTQGLFNGIVVQDACFAGRFFGINQPNFSL